MEYPGDLRYTKEHEWVRVEEGVATIGITEYAQSELGEIVFVELPEEARELEKGEAVCVAESTKAASDIYAPIGGAVKEVNEALNDNPGLINTSPYVDGWLVKLSGFSEAELDELLSPDEYSAYVEDQG